MKNKKHAYICAFTSKEGGIWNKCKYDCIYEEEKLVERCCKNGWHSIKLSDGKELDVINGFREKNTQEPVIHKFPRNCWECPKRKYTSYQCAFYFGDLDCRNEQKK